MGEDNLSVVEDFIFGHYGRNRQILKLCEECAELIQALIKGDEVHIAEELADVEILWGQVSRGMELTDMVAMFRRMKLSRQIGRLSAPKGEDGVVIPDSVKNALKPPFSGLRDEDRTISLRSDEDVKEFLSENEGAIAGKSDPTDWD